LRHLVRTFPGLSSDYQTGCLPPSNPQKRPLASRIPTQKQRWRACAEPAIPYDISSSADSHPILSIFMSRSRILVLVLVLLAVGAAVGFFWPRHRTQTLVLPGVV